jgi:GT2 family glycosyltransferase
MSPRRKVQIQSVLFDPPGGSLERHLRGIRQAATFLSRDDDSFEVAVCFGDCSARPALDASAVASTRSFFSEKEHLSFRYEFFGENLGHGGGQNRLLRERDGADFVLILNPDTCLSPQALVALLALMADATIGITEARQVPLEHQKAYDEVTGDTSWASGACSLMRSAVFDLVGGFDDTTFFMYCDDVDLSWRARLAGYRVVHQPKAAVFHDKRLSQRGTYVPSDAEKYYSALASVFLAAKYSRPDIVKARLDDLDRSPEAIHKRAASEYRRREAAGILAAPLDPQGSVAQFQTYAYADLRFDYAF